METLELNGRYLIYRAKAQDSGEQILIKMVIIEARPMNRPFLNQQVQYKFIFFAG